MSQVLTDSCCNLHVTSTECFERAVRLPAALKAAKQAGAGKSDRLKLSSGVGGKYLELAENKVIRMAHSKTYLRRMKKRCLAVTNPTEVVPLTEDSEGNGGEDTSMYSALTANVIDDHHENSFASSVYFLLLQL